MDLLQMMGQRLNLTYAIIPSSEGKWGAQLDNGTWTGAFGMMYRKVRIKFRGSKKYY